MRRSGVGTSAAVVASIVPDSAALSRFVEVKLVAREIDDRSVGTENIHSEQSDDLAATARIEAKLAYSQIVRSDVYAADFERANACQLRAADHSRSIEPVRVFIAAAFIFGINRSSTPAKVAPVSMNMYPAASLISTSTRQS